MFDFRNSQNNFCLVDYRRVVEDVNCGFVLVCIKEQFGWSPAWLYCGLSDAFLHPYRGLRASVFHKLGNL